MKLSPYIRYILLLVAIYSAIFSVTISSLKYILLYSTISAVCAAIYTYSENTKE